MIPQIRLAWLIMGVAVTCLLASVWMLAQNAIRGDLERQNRDRERALEDRVRLALWRMDAFLAPVIAREAARPDAFYRADPPLKPHLPSNVEYVEFHFHWPRPVSSNEDPTNAVDSNGDDRPRPASDPRFLALRRHITWSELRSLLPSAEFAQMAVATEAINQYYVGNANGMGEGGARGSDPGELNLRNRAYQTQTAQQAIQQRGIEPPQTKEGLCRPVWLGERLCLARYSERDGREAIQGCQFDWLPLRSDLLLLIHDLLPNADLRPHRDGPVIANRILAGVPAELVVPAESASTHVSPEIWWMVLGCGGGIVVAVGSLLALVFGAWRLSAQRASFVSSVTHELRTPLTTFRLYSEQLAKGLVPEAERSSYLRTLCVEADRLSHLIDNVLTFARLERGRAASSFSVLTVRELLNGFEERFRARAQQGGMELQIECDAEISVRRIRVDPAALEQILFNLIDNACKFAGNADDRRVHLRVTGGKDQIIWEVSDHGPGMDEMAKAGLFQAFSKSASRAADTRPGVGLGLALVRRLARGLDGTLSVQHPEEGGCRITLSLVSSAGER